MNVHPIIDFGSHRSENLVAEAATYAVEFNC